MESKSPTLPTVSSKSKRLSAISDADKILRQFVTPNNPSVESIRQSIQRSTLESQVKEEIKPRLDFS
jgi:dephospho-CoA kinase